MTRNTLAAILILGSFVGIMSGGYVTIPFGFIIMMFGFLLASYSLLESPKERYWYKSSEQLPWDKPCVYLIVRNGDYVALGFYDSTNRWSSWPEMDDLNSKVVTHWSIIHMP